jgi:hypothetical protein
MSSASGPSGEAAFAILMLVLIVCVLGFLGYQSRYGKSTGSADIATGNDEGTNVAADQGGYGLPPSLHAPAARGEGKPQRHVPRRQPSSTTLVTGKPAAAANEPGNMSATGWALPVVTNPGRSNSVVHQHQQSFHETTAHALEDIAAVSLENVQADSLNSFLDTSAQNGFGVGLGLQEDNTVTMVGSGPLAARWNQAGNQPIRQPTLLSNPDGDMLTQSQTTEFWPGMPSIRTESDSVRTQTLNNMFGRKESESDSAVSEGVMPAFSEAEFVPADLSSSGHNVVGPGVRLVSVRRTNPLAALDNAGGVVGGGRVSSAI